VVAGGRGADWGELSETFDVGVGKILMTVSADSG